MFNNITLTYLTAPRWFNPRQSLGINYLSGFLLSLLIYFFYLELNPKIGGIFFRPNSIGGTSFNPFGVIPMLKQPFQNLQWWHPQNWDLNWITFTQISTLFYLTLVFFNRNYSEGLLSYLSA